MAIFENLPYKQTRIILYWLLFPVFLSYFLGHCGCMDCSTYLETQLILSTTIVFVLIPQYTVLSSVLPGNKNWIEVVGIVLVLLGSTLESM